MGWVSNERAMLISRQIRAGMCRWEHNVETQSQVPSITQKQNKREWMHLNIFLYLQVLKLYNFNTYLTCSCFLCLSVFAVLHKKRAGNARVTVAAMGRTWFFNQTRLRLSLAFNRCIKISLSAVSGLLSLSGLILAFFLFILLSSLRFRDLCQRVGPHDELHNLILYYSILFS